MAKKIVISYVSNPIANDEFKYKLTLNSVLIPYGSLTELKITYRAQGTGNSNPYGVEIQSNLSQTINNTVAFLQAQYSSPNIIYTRVNDTIEIDVNIDNIVVLDLAKTGNSITVSSSDIVPNEDVNLKYFFEYDNVDGDYFLCKINKKEYSGVATQIYGKANITKGKAKDHLDTFRGTGLDIKLEANIDLTLEDLYTDDEQSFTVRFYKNNKLVFRGFLKPDDVFESFVQDAWYINLTAIDGLGILENLSFVKENGMFFVGKMKAFDIVYYCLNRIGIPMKINTYINTYYEGLTPSDTLDPLQKTILNANRFVKVDDNTIMSCEEVLKSVLDIFQAVITQVDGEWYIYKPNELYGNQYPKFRRYSETGTFLSVSTKFIGGVLGSQIDNFYPHHCGGNQRKKIKGAISAFRLGYKYGFIQGLFSNPNFKHDGMLNYDNWTEINMANVINDPTYLTGLRINTVQSGGGFVVMRSENIPFLTGDTTQIKISYETKAKPTNVIFRVRQGNYYLRYNVNVNNGVAEWQTLSNVFVTVNRLLDTGDTNSQLFTLEVPAMLNDGNLYVEILQPTEAFNADVVYLKSLDIINTFKGDNKQGEFHTVQRRNKPSSLIKANNTVYNGDNDKIVYLGAIFKDDLITPTSLWFRRGTFENKPLLRISAEEELRIQQKPMIDFFGDVKGEMPYLSIITINNVQGKFMPIEWDYDTVRNVCTIRYLELYAEELDDIDYVFTYDFGNTVKPTILG